MKTVRVVLKPGKEKPFQGRHPWVYSGAIEQIDDDYEAGDLVEVLSSQEQFLGTGYLNPRSQIGYDLSVGYRIDKRDGISGCFLF